jgi:hypothetical protein
MKVIRAILDRAARIGPWLPDLAPAEQPTGGIAEAEPAFSRGSDGRVYYMGAGDRERLRPIFLRDPRAVRNEREATRRRSSGSRPAAGSPYASRGLLII